MSYGRTFPIWRSAAGDHWPAYIQHEFVARLADGSLPRSAYLHYLTQDYVFLIHFSRAWALGVTKAETLDEMRYCAAAVNALICDELRLHVSTCAAAGISEDQLFLAEERPENLAYTRFVLDAGHSGDFLDLLAALAPCIMGYGEIGARLSPGTGPYSSWIAAYGNQKYQDLCHRVGALIDGAVARRLGGDPEASPRWSTLCTRFTKATRLEADFWRMGLAP